MTYEPKNRTGLHEEAAHLQNNVRVCEPFASRLPRDRSWDVHDRKRQLVALQQRYREADDYNRPAVRLLIRNVVDGLVGERA